MEVRFADSFFESLKILNRHQTWWYKTYHFFRYDVGRFFSNIYRFRKELWNFYPWDYVYNLRLLKRSLELTKKSIERGHEVEDSRMKKVAKIQRTIEILDNICEDKFIELAEKELGKQLILSSWNPVKSEEEDLWEIEEDPENVREWNSEILKRSRELQKSEWKELWEILKGKDYQELGEHNQENHEEYWKSYEEWFDGSDMRGWWD